MIGLKTVIFAVLLVSFAVSVHCYCDSHVLSSCLDNTVFEKYKHRKSHELFVYHDEEEMAQICSDIKIVSKCWAPVIEDCKLTVRALYQGVHDGFDYMCGDGYNEYMKNRVCLSKRTLGDKGKQCSDRFKQKVSYIKHDAESGMSKSTLTEEVCRDIGDAKRCVYEAVRSECKEEAAKFERTFIDKLLRPMEHLAGCGQLTMVQIILIAGGACLGFIVLTVLAALVYRRMRGGAGRRGVVYMLPESGEAAPHTGRQKPNLEFENPLSQQYENPPPYKN